ncbi:elongation factor P maturation arginine rhamnosyltransferase EarP [Rubrivivax rivuli]|uniref:Protein-arginine rhamnosyltransferase n=1 Tax=Rubrivivax rivuli TaxID=1862385 RepID=A0A437RF05_9BURK|nr:elongation factor P maturation arginine rhamnosyltransferase EarP [Rubrivivax rivuli]RVU45323.1 elongation factor P maturation arginine rhamnosyltransferase EarP [Rubrivivax rivuli]
MPALLWDVYCRVIDNLGDAGVCWRLAVNLAQRGQHVRVVIDDAAPLAFMAPNGAPGVEVLPWPGPATPGDVVVEAFGCDPPAKTVAAMARRTPPPLWLNLEYLSAEAYVERSHRLPSPQFGGPGAGLTKWFFYPGFTPATGGLLREPGLAAAHAAFDRHAWLQAQGQPPLRPGEQVMALFCYDNPALPALLAELARTDTPPTRLLLTPGPAQRQVAALWPQPPAAVQVHALPWLTQAGFDQLLWAADLNFVRGEDSLVRALWAGAPFVWQVYPQDDGAHAAKLQALAQRLQLPADVAALWRAWNGLQAPWPGLPPRAGAWAAAAQAASAAQAAQPDLATQLLAFVQMQRPGSR